ncbi:NTP transferase domain-containing protein [Gordonia sp. ABSL1-1]|uniref:nucleotidyltransferase family protein n=1 Tax=Gordonia sp. ABSL1-1 TaxID=3053923 RepID=UPI0025741BC3|nr:NTP transferase domain-containing protein [Gordonia sp. ABSL1-1]MDL9937106.1 NTP transferase domain-containing protein [Gordonia sp. ABSL1-1]
MGVEKAVEPVGAVVPGVVGVVLAAGAGTRYGMPKILAQQGGWLESAVAELRLAGCPEVLVAMGAAVVEPPAGATALAVPEWSAGLGATVGAALRAVRGRPGLAGVVLHVVDIPDVGEPVVTRVLRVADGRRDVLVRAVFGGEPGHPVYLGADHLDGALAVLHGDEGLRSYLSGRDDVVAVECGDLATGRDVDYAD